MRTVGDIMSTHARWVAPDATVRSAVLVMSQHRIGSVLVGGPAVPLAIMTEADVVRQVLAANRNPSVVLVRDIMRQPLITVAASRPIEEAGDLMAEHAIRHVAVTRRGKVVGLVSVRDLVSQVAVLPLSLERMMPQLLVIVPTDETVDNAAALMAHACVSGLLVRDHAASRSNYAKELGRHEIAGVLTESDLVHDIVARDRDPSTTSVSEVMSRVVHTLDSQEPLPVALALMAKQHTRHIGVTTAQHVLGLLAIEDVFEPAWLHVAAAPKRRRSAARSA